MPFIQTLGYDVFNPLEVVPEFRNNRKTICRIYLNTNKKYIGVFDAAKKETRNEIQSLDDIYVFSEGLKGTVDTYLGLGV